MNGAADSQESYLTMGDGTRLFIRDWLVHDSAIKETHQENKPQPCVVILHGLGEHCGRYGHVATFFNSHGLSVRTFDHRGHGQSEGARGDCPDSTAIANDAEIVIRDFAGRCQTLPILFGHSMGGLLAAYLATSFATSAPQQPQLSGLILSSPALGLRLTALHRLLHKLFLVTAPHFAMSLPFKPDQLSHELAAVAAYINDPFVHHQATATLLESLLSAIDFVQRHAPILSIPVLLLVAEQDSVVNPQGSHDFFKALPNGLATAHFYADYFHEIFNEIGSDKVFDDVQDWLTAHRMIHQ